MTLAEHLANLGTATVGEVAPAAGLLDGRIRPVGQGVRLAGPARTVRCRPGDNLALHLAIYKAEVGDVIVADYNGDTDSGPFGEIMALACQMRGIAGLIINGAVRDSAQIAAMGFPVFARGLNIRGTTKDDRGELDATLDIGGVTIRPGDMIVADADAVLVLPAASVSDTLLAGDRRVAKEDRMMARLRAGETTICILGLDGETTS